MPAGSGTIVVSTIFVPPSLNATENVLLSPVFLPATMVWRTVDTSLEALSVRTGLPEVAFQNHSGSNFGLRPSVSAEADVERVDDCDGRVGLSST